MERSHSPIYVLVRRIIAIFLTHNVLSVLSLATLPPQTILPRNCSLVFVFDVRSPDYLPGCLDKFLTNMAATSNLCLSISSSTVNKSAHKPETMGILGSFEVSYILYSCADFWVENKRNSFHSMKLLRKLNNSEYNAKMNSSRLCRCLNHTLSELLCSSHQQLGSYQNSNLIVCPTQPWMFSRLCRNVWNMEYRMHNRHKVNRRFPHTSVKFTVNDQQNMNFIHLTSNLTTLRLSIRSRVHCWLTNSHEFLGSIKSSQSGTSSEVAHEIKYHSNNSSPRRKRAASCPVGSYGPACVPCHCRNEERCHRVSGRCWPDICATGWEGDSCSVRLCPEGYYSNGEVKCRYKCQCPVGVDCHGVTGECQVSNCTRLPADSCELQVCPRKFFGDAGCQSSCHCQTDETCHPRTGECHFSLCHYGFLPPACQETDPHTHKRKVYFAWAQVLLFVVKVVIMILFRVVPLIRHICRR